MTEDAHIRESLGRLLGKTLTERQWGLIVAQGYDEAIISGTRTIEEVARELRGLMESAGEQTGSGQPVSALTWDEMEKSVLGHVLAAEHNESDDEPTLLPVDKARVEIFAVDRGRARRHWWLGLTVSVIVLVAALAAVLMLGGFQCGSDLVEAASGASGGGPEGTGANAWVLPISSTTTLPPTTTTEPEVLSYEADLYGTEVVPLVRSEAGGHLELTFSDDGETVSYILSFEDIERLTVARLRVAPVGEKGDEIYTVYPGPAMEGKFSGVAAEDSFTAEDFVGEFEGQSMADFRKLLDDGLVYLIVGTEENRSGEIRGQLK